MPTPSAVPTARPAALLLLLLLLERGGEPALAACSSDAETALAHAALASIMPRQWLYTAGGQRAAKRGWAPSADAASSRYESPTNLDRAANASVGLPSLRAAPTTQ